MFHICEEELIIGTTDKVIEICLSQVRLILRPKRNRVIQSGENKCVEFFRHLTETISISNVGNLEGMVRGRSSKR